MSFDFDEDSISYTSKQESMLPTTSDLYSLTNVHKALREITKQTVTSSIETFLIINKEGLDEDLKMLMNWFLLKKCTVYVERKHKEMLAAHVENAICRINYYSVTPNCDLIITLGGDGTVLYASWMYQRVVPPIIAFHLGSLGFLTVFNFNEHNEIMNKIWSGTGVKVSMRMRLQCQVHKTVVPRQSRAPSVTRNKSQSSKRRSQSESISHSLTSLSISPTVKSSYSELSPPSPLQSLRILASSLQGNENYDDTLHVLNEVVIDRGPCPFLTTLEVWGDGVLLTICQADGLVVSTPTGSTAYSLSAGGSLCHPDVNAILVTPICAHTLRPMILPECMELKIKVPLTARNTAWASFDGKHRIELQQGDYVSIKCSPFSLPTISSENTTGDWFHSLQRCLKWNERVVQRPRPDGNATTSHTFSDESSKPKLKPIPSEDIL